MTGSELSEAENSESAQMNPVVDIAAGLVLAAVACFALFWLFPNYIDSGGRGHDVGPMFFPKLAAWAVLGLSIFLVIVRTARFAVTDGGLSGRSILLEIFAWIIIAILTMAGFIKAGFLIIAPLLIFAGAWMCGYRKWWIMAVLAIGFPLIVNQAAWLVFTVDLP